MVGSTYTKLTTKRSSHLANAMQIVLNMPSVVKERLSYLSNSKSLPEVFVDCRGFKTRLNVLISNHGLLTPINENIIMKNNSFSFVHNIILFFITFHVEIKNNIIADFSKEKSNIIFLGLSLIDR